MELPEGRCHFPRRLAEETFIATVQVRRSMILARSWVSKAISYDRQKAARIETPPATSWVRQSCPRRQDHAFWRGDAKENTLQR